MIDELGGLFMKEERRQVEELKNQPLPEGMTAMDVYNDLRLKMLRRKGGDVEELTDEQLLELRRRPLLPERRRSHLPGEHHVVPGSPERSRPRQHNQGSLDTRVGVAR